MQETDVIYILHYNQSFLLCFQKVHRSSLNRVPTTLFKEAILRNTPEELH